MILPFISSNFILFKIFKTIDFSRKFAIENIQYKAIFNILPIVEIQTQSLAEIMLFKFFQPVGK